MRSDARANRDRILSAAEAVFGEAGAEGSTEEVARRAGVGIGTVFRHFPTKRDLVEATVVRHFEQLTVRARELSALDDPTAALRRLIEVMVGGGATKIALLALLAESGGFTDPAVRASQDLRDVFGALLRRAQQAGTVRRDVSVDEVYLLIRGLSQASAHAPAKKPALRKALAVVLDGLAPPA
jgi:AcrR family transcriptional regulator